ncbi:cytochrome P450 [Microlunatus lacustris]
MRRLFRTEHRIDTDVDISSVAFWAQPFELRDLAFARLRAERPVSWHPALETPGYPRSKHHEAGFWAVTTAEDIAYVSRHHELFSSELGQVNLRPAPFQVESNMLVLDPPAHEALRRVVSAAFTPKAVARLERMVERRSKQIVARAAARGEFDFVRHVAAQLPLRTIADLFGLPPSEHDSFVVAADAYVGSGFPAQLPAGTTIQAFYEAQVAYLRNLCRALARYRRSVPAEDLMTCLVTAEVDGRPLSDEEILSTMLLLVVAGHDTTKQACTLSVLALHDHPAERDWLAEDFEGRIDNAVEELIRYASPVIVFARTATVDTRLNGVPIAAGDKVALFYCSGNRDATVFTSPGTLDLGRRPARHVAFGGGGVHYCLGSAVARAELKALFREILRRMPRLDVGVPQYVFSDFVHGVEALPVKVVR